MLWGCKKKKRIVRYVNLMFQKLDYAIQAYLQLMILVLRYNCSYIIYTLSNFGLVRCLKRILLNMSQKNDIIVKVII